MGGEGGKSGLGGNPAIDIGPILPGSKTSSKAGNSISPNLPLRSSMILFQVDGWALYLACFGAGKRATFRDSWSGVYRYTRFKKKKKTPLDCSLQKYLHKVSFFEICCRRERRWIHFLQPLQRPWDKSVNFVANEFGSGVWAQR